MIMRFNSFQHSFLVIWDNMLPIRGTCRLKNWNTRDRPKEALPEEGRIKTGETAEDDEDTDFTNEIRCDNMWQNNIFLILFLVASSCAIAGGFAWRDAIRRRRIRQPVGWVARSPVWQFLFQPRLRVTLFCVVVFQLKCASLKMVLFFAKEEATRRRLFVVLILFFYKRLCTHQSLHLLMLYYVAQQQ